MGRNRVRRRSEPSFFKVLIRDFSERLQIPPAFVKRYFDKGPREVKLHSFSKRFWVVQVTKQTDGAVFFQEGWNNFVKYNSLQLGEFLVFHYNGHSRFDVDIYGKNSCRKTAGIIAQRGKKQKEEEKEGNGFKKDSTEGQKSANNKSRGERYKKIAPIVTISDGSSGSDVGTTTGKRKRSYNYGRNNIFKGRMSESDRAKLLELTEAPKPRNPFFVAVMQRSYFVSLSMNVPLSFARSYLHENRDITIRDLDGISWSLEYIMSIEAHHARAMFKHGWHKFACENGLQVGDVCIFELIDTMKSVFQVSIFRNGEDGAGSRYLPWKATLES